HALVREAAYALLPDDARRVGHALAAGLMEADGTHDAAVIARHFELGQMFPAAARWYARAAEHALSHNDLTAALAHAQRAQRWTDEPGARGNLELIIAEVQFWRGDLAQACAAAVRAAALQPVASSSWFQAVGLIVTASGQQGDDATVAHWCERVLELEPSSDVLSEFVLCLSRASSQLAWGEHHELGHAALARADAVAREALGPSAEARREFARAYDRMRDGIVDACVASLREVAEIYTRIGATRDALQMTMLGHAMGLYGGFIDAGLAALEQCIADAERMDARYLADWARWEVACAFLMKGELASGDAQLALVSRAVNAQPLLRDVSTMLRAWAAFHNDDIGELEAIVASSSITHRRFRAALAGFAAYVNFRRGDAASACDQAREAIAVLVATPGVRGDGGLAGFVPALATLVGAGAPDAIAALEEHLARLESIAGKIVDPAYREALLHGAPWNRRVRELRDEVMAR
ncbi:MAG TPA: hypothetical protein VLB44_15175, partial [Kofleriaceae bacterium]|nr:hypothetical protein [Kofleriaceae bacterium]